MRIILAILIMLALLAVGCSSQIYYCTVSKEYKSVLVCIPENKIEVPEKK